MTIDADALRTGLTNEQRELRDAIAADEATLRDQDDDGVRAAIQLRQSQLRKVEHALERHAAGTWQVCEECDATITDELRTIPTATHCADCAKGQVYWGDTQVISKADLGL